MNEFDYVKSLLSNVTSERPDKFMASCPVHGEDKRPSLRVFLKHDGGAGFHCFAGCDYKNIRAALGLKSSAQSLTEEQRREIAEENARKAALHKKQVAAVARRLARNRPDIAFHNNVNYGMQFIEQQWGLTRSIVDELKIGFCHAAPLYRKSPSITFPYYDRAGKLVRLSHRLIAPGERTGKYYPHTKEMPVALYNSPALNTASELLLVEGEAKTAYVYQFLPAVGISGKNAFMESWAAWFAGKTVYIALDPDANEQANKYGEWIAAAGGIARIVSLPDKIDDYMRANDNGIELVMNAMSKARRVYYNPDTGKTEYRSGGNRSYWSNLYSFV